jgi:hypothetical protein
MSTRPAPNPAPPHITCCWREHDRIPNSRWKNHSSTSSWPIYSHSISNLDYQRAGEHRHCRPDAFFSNIGHYDIRYSYFPDSRRKQCYSLPRRRRRHCSYSQHRISSPTNTSPRLSNSHRKPRRKLRLRRPDTHTYKRVLSTSSSMAKPSQFSLPTSPPVISPLSTLVLNPGTTLTANSKGNFVLPDGQTLTPSNGAVTIHGKTISLEGTTKTMTTTKTIKDTTRITTTRSPTPSADGAAPPSSGAKGRMEQLYHSLQAALVLCSFCIVWSWAMT